MYLHVMYLGSLLYTNSIVMWDICLYWTSLWTWNITFLIDDFLKLCCIFCEVICFGGDEIWWFPEKLQCHVIEFVDCKFLRTCIFIESNIQQCNSYNILVVHVNPGKYYPTKYNMISQYMCCLSYTDAVILLGIMHYFSTYLRYTFTSAFFTVSVQYRYLTTSCIFLSGILYTY